MVSRASFAGCRLHFGSCRSEFHESDVGICCKIYQEVEDIEGHYNSSVMVTLLLA